MERGIEVAGSIVAEGGDDRLLAAGADHAAGLGVLHPGLGDVLLEPGEGARNRPVVGVDHAGVAADQRGEGDGFRGREGEVPAGTVLDASVLAAPAQLGTRAVRHLAFEQRAEGAGIDRPRQPELFRPLARPGARFPVLGIVLGVVAVALVVARALGRGGDGPDRGDHLRS